MELAKGVSWFVIMIEIMGLAVCGGNFCRLINTYSCFIFYQITVSTTTTKAQPDILVLLLYCFAQYA